MDDNPELAARVAAGANYLDRHRPGWWLKVKRRRLDMSNSCDCVVGQTDGGFFAGLQSLGLDMDDAERMGLTAFDDMNSGAVEAEFAELDKAWRAEIKQRLDDHKI